MAEAPPAPHHPPLSLSPTEARLHHCRPRGHAGRHRLQLLGLQAGQRLREGECCPRPCPWGPPSARGVEGPRRQGAAGGDRGASARNSLQREALDPECAASSIISADSGPPRVGREQLCPEPRGLTKNRRARPHRQIGVLGSQSRRMEQPAPWAWVGRTGRRRVFKSPSKSSLHGTWTALRVFSLGSDGPDQSSRLPSKGAGLQEETPTCSLFQGTVIRVFSVPDGQKLYEFRRGMKRSVFTVCVCACSVASVVPDATAPRTVGHQAPLSMGFSRQQYWSGLPCPPPRDLPDPGIEPESLVSPALAGGFFTTSATREALKTSVHA